MVISCESDDRFVTRLALRLSLERPKLERNGCDYDIARDWIERQAA